MEPPSPPTLKTSACLRCPPSPQIEVLRARLDGWVDKVSNAAITLEDEAVGVAVQPMVS